MELKEQFNEFVAAVSAMPRDELGAYMSILMGLILIIIAILSW